jgi:hypothetical protein
MKIIITETQNKELLKRLRRIQEVKDIITYQTEIQDPCNFEDGEDYAEFCIDQGISFFYGDEGYERDNEVFSDETEDHGRDIITDLMYDEFYNDFISLWNDSDC